MITVKKLEPEDKAKVSEWLAKDEVHQQLGLKFEDILEPQTVAYVVSDETGPLMAVRLHKALRVAIQFDPENHYRTAKAAKEVMDWFRTVADEIEAKEVIIRPGGKAVQFADKLGFEDFNGKFIKC